MDEETDVTSRLEDCGFLAGVRWAFESRQERLRADYLPGAGYRGASGGIMAHELFIDRMNRVCSTEDFLLSENVDPQEGRDLLVEELSAEQVRTMPLIPQGVIARSNPNNSPGFVFDDIRVLFASFPFGGADDIVWLRKSPTKQGVARQPRPDVVEMDGLDLPPLPTITEIGDFEGRTFILAHSFNIDPWAGELYLGSSRLGRSARGARNPWNWRRDLLGFSSPGESFGWTTGPRLPAGSPTTSVADAPVRLRGQAKQAGE